MFDLNSSIFSNTVTAEYFYVFYDPESGQLLDILRKPTDEKLLNDHLRLPIDHELVLDVMFNRLSVTQLIVAFDKDTNKRNIFKKDNYLRKIQSDNHQLYKVDRVREASLGTQVTITFSKKDQLAEVQINKSSLDGFLSLVNDKNVMYEGMDHLDFYVTNSNDPLMLYGTLRVTTDELIKKGRISIPIAWYQGQRLSVHTKRVFSSYQFIEVNEMIDTPSKYNNYSAQYPSEHSGVGHVCINGTTITSNIIDPVKYAIFDHLDLHVVKKKDPSYYVKSIRLDIDQLKNNATAELEEAIDSNLIVVHDNPHIRVTIV